MASWADSPAYIEQQRRRLPSHKFRRLHLNLPGAPNGAFLDQAKVMEAIEPGSKPRLPQRGVGYYAFVDMSGGSSDDACLAIAHVEDDICVLDLVVKQNGPAPFNPRNAVTKFCDILHDWGVGSVVGDDYAGSTFRHDFQDRGIKYISSHLDTTEIYETFEPRLNAGEVRLYDEPTLTQQLLTLVVRGAKVSREPGGHDDYANACCGAINLAAGKGYGVRWAAVSGDGRIYSADTPRPTPSPPRRGIENNNSSLM